MKSLTFIAVLAALAVFNDAASIPNEVGPFEEILEFPESVDKYIKDYDLEGSAGRQLSREDELILFYEESFSLPAAPHTEQVRDVVYRGNSTTLISRIVIFNPPPVPGHTYVNNRRTNAHVRLRSGLGRALSCRVQFFGTYSD